MTGSDSGCINTDKKKKKKNTLLICQRSLINVGYQFLLCNTKRKGDLNRFASQN